MTAKINIAGQRFERLVAIEDVGRNKHKQVIWLCKCDCGNEIEVTTASLRKGHTRSCGCLQKEAARENTSKELTGKRFGKLVVIEESKQKHNKKGGQRVVWICKCDCGNLCEVVTSHLTSGGTESCGCIQKDGLRKRMTGKNHPLYNPDLTTEQRLKHRYVIGSNKYASLWRQKVFERDDYTCNICKDRNGNGHRVVLNAHHLDGWNWCKEKRFDEDNGITLCRDCHDSFHRQYGNGNNTKEQFEEYKNKVLV